MLKTIICETCGHEQEYDLDNDVLVCDECDNLIFVPIAENETRKENHAPKE